MPYHVGSKGSNGCSGYPVVADNGRVMGCHPTEANANDQVAALYAAGAAEKGDNKMNNEDIKKQYDGCGCPTCKEMNVDCPDCPICSAKKADMPATCDCASCTDGCDCGDCTNCGGDITKSQKQETNKSLFANFGRIVEPVQTVRDTYKRDYSSASRERMASEGTAMPDGSYPIANKKDLMNAIRSWGRGGAKEDVKRHIMSRARSLGAEDLIPENWKSTSKSIWSFNFKPRSY
jgi:hypothetical protein